MKLTLIQKLKRSCSAGSNAGHFLNTIYGIPSKGEGEDVILARLTANEISSRETSSSLNPATGFGGEGIQGGWSKSLGSV